MGFIYNQSLEAAAVGVIGEYLSPPPACQKYSSGVKNTISYSPFKTPPLTDSSDLLVMHALKTPLELKLDTCNIKQSKVS